MTRYLYDKSNLPPYKNAAGKLVQKRCYYSDECGLWRTATHVCVPCRGQEKRPKLMLVGEAPGNQEDRANQPFVGPAGQTLTDALEEANIPPEDILITNLVRCIPRSGRSVRAPTEDEIEVCSRYLNSEIDRSRPVIIVPMGNTAADWFLGKGKISQRRGRVYEQIQVGDRQAPATIMPTWHPAYVIRNRAAMEDLVGDLRNAYRRAVGARNPEEFLKIETITSLERFAEWVDETVKLAEAGRLDRLAVDLETSGPTRAIALNAYHPDSYIVGVCLARDEKHGVFVALEHRGHEGDGIPSYQMEGYDKLAISGLLDRLFSACRVVTHNGKFDVRFITAKYDVWPSELHYDTKLACYLLDGKDGSHGLKFLGMKYLKFGSWDSELNKYWDPIPSTQRVFDRVPLRIIARYGGIDAVATHRLVPEIRKRMRKRIKTRLLLKKILEGVIAFNEFERHGNRVDRKEWERLKDDYWQRAQKILNKVRKSPAGRATESMTDAKLNLNAPEHVRILVHGCMKVPTNEDFITSTGKPSMSDEALLWMINWAERKKRHEVREILLDIRSAKKILNLRSKYLTSLDKFLIDDILHPDYHFHVQHTGRASTRKPSIHTLPYGSDIRRLFVTYWYTEGGLLLDADYSQLELRVLAMLCADPKLRQVFESGEDLHAAVTAEIYGISLKRVKTTADGKQKRRHTKTVVFGIIYGRGAKAIAKATGLTELEAQRIIDRLFERFPAVANYIAQQHRFVEKHEYVESPTGRIYPLPHVHSGHQDMEAKAERQAQNYPIQGGASDITLLAILDTYRALKECYDGTAESLPVGFIHDAQIVDVAPGEFPEVFDVLIDTMERRVLESPENKILLDWVNVPLKVEAQIGGRWDGGMAVEKVGDRIYRLEGPVAFYKELQRQMKIAYSPKFSVVRQWVDEDWTPFALSARQAYAGDAAGKHRCEVEMTL